MYSSPFPGLSLRSGDGEFLSILYADSNITVRPLSRIGSDYPTALQIIPLG